MQPIHFAGSQLFGPLGVGDLAFTMGEPAAGFAATIAEFGYGEGWRNAYVLFDDTIQFTAEECAGFKASWENLGGEILAEDTFQQGDASVAGQITRYQALDPQPDVIFTCSYSPGVWSAVKQYRAAGIDTPVMHDGSWDGTFWQEALPDVSDIYLSTYASIFGDDPDPDVNEFFENFTELSGEAPLTSYPLTGYAIMQSIEKAILETGGTDGAALAEVIENFTDEPTALGPTNFTPEVHMDTYRTMAILEIQNGQTSFVTTIKPEFVLDTTDLS